MERGKQAWSKSGNTRTMFLTIIGGYMLISNAVGTTANNTTTSICDS
ncbi:exported hypothetical protein [Candidatus Desulfosporosinus infrequens]|uniref:Uncharacterized protein n=1 Tax=Candidatus Desulfosporosinus infrequens TaxID=2043169 RepID=A0A2U3L9W6_9FIRM|nr:exported hypothetical protein [Candidatus Desulfosporosinus infrequens]